MSDIEDFGDFEDLRDVDRMRLITTSGHMRINRSVISVCNDDTL